MMTVSRLRPETVRTISRTPRHRPHRHLGATARLNACRNVSLVSGLYSLGERLERDSFTDVARRERRHREATSGDLFRDHRVHGARAANRRFGAAAAGIIGMEATC